MFHNLYQSSFFTVPITIRDLRCDKETKGASTAAPRRVRAGGTLAPEAFTRRPRPARASRHVPLVAAPTRPRASPCILPGPGAPLPASLPPRSKAAEKVQGAPGPPRRAHPGSCATSLHLSRPRRRAPRPKPETRLPSATPKPEKSSPVPDCSTDPGAAPQPAVSSPLGSRQSTSPRPLGPRTLAGTRRNGGRQRVAMATPGAP